VQLILTRKTRWYLLNKLYRFFYILFLASFIISNESPLIENYHTYGEIQEKLNNWNEVYGNDDNPQPSYYSNSGIIYKLEEIGSSNVNDLPIYAVKLSYDADQNLDKPRVLILGQCHAEEIYGVEMSMALIEMFLDPSLLLAPGYEYLPSASEVNPYTDLRNILSRVEIWVVPTHNPDGLQIVHGYEDDNLGWIQDVSYRKNLTDTNNNGIFDYVSYILGTLDAGNDLDGVDLNRNYDFHFDYGNNAGNLHVEDDYHSCGFGEYRSSYDYYKGEAAFSEAEVEAIRNFALEKNFTLSVAYHSSRSGCVSELVIYPWDWSAIGKVAPDFDAISSIGDNIASLIPTQDETIHELLHYKGASSYSRRGQAHDWFYARTGCYQYLIELGIGGDEGIQTSSVDFYNEVLRNNFKGLFYLLYRSLGDSFDNVEQYGITGIVADKDTNLPIEDVIYKIDEIYTPILDARKTDSFGRYRWILSDQNNSSHISFLHWDYEPVYLEPFNIGSGSITNLDINLVPKQKYEMQFNLLGPDNALITLKNEDGLLDSLYLSSGLNTLSIPEGSYGFQLTSAGYCPIIEELVINIDNIMEINLTQCNQLDITSQNSSDPPLYIEGDIYNDNITTCRSYSGFESASFLHFNMAYELEWVHDSLLIYLSDENIPDIIYTDQNWAGNDYYIELDDTTDYSGSNLRFCLVADESFGYKGVKINDVYALSGNSEFTLSNNIILLNEISLSQNYPNPFNPKTQIDFSISNPSNISLQVYDLNGVLVDKIIDNEYYNSGKFSIFYSPQFLSSGVYFYKLNDGKKIIAKKMIHLK